MQTSGTTDNLTTVSCPSTTACWASDGSTAGKALATSNSGSSWAFQTTTGTNISNGIACASTSDCWETFISGVAATTNGGTTWSNETISASSTNQIVCPTTSNCWTTDGGGTGTIYVTTNGGSFWSNQSDSLGESAVACFNTSDCWVAGSGYMTNVPEISVTTNGGTTWTSQTVPGTGSQGLNGIACASASVCWAVGNSGYIVATTNGGSTWTAQTSGTSNALNAVACPSTTTCWAVGASGTIVTTSNGGSTWTAQTSGTTNALNGIACPSTSLCWAVGASGTIVSTAAGSSYASDGSGTMTVSPTTASASATGQTFTFTYTAATGGTSSGEIDLTIPAGWSAPQKVSGAAGYTLLGSCGGGAIGTISGTGPWTIPITGVTLAGAATCTITYGSGGGTSGVTVPSSTGTATFTTQEKSTAGGTLTSLASPPIVSVTTVSTTTTVTSSLNPSPAGQSVTYTASVSPATGPTGTLTFSDGVTAICSNVALTGSGQATCSPAAYSAAGSHSITAVYSGDSTYATSTSAAITENVVGWWTDATPTVSGTSNYLAGVACASATTCFAVGNLGSGSYLKSTLILQWNGSTWARVTSANTGAQDVLTAVACSSATNCFAVGWTCSSASFGNCVNPKQTLIEQWNGSTWAVVTSANASTSDNVLNGISCVSGSSYCWAVGYGALKGGSGNTYYQQALAEQWTGTTWTVATTPDFSATQAELLTGVSCLSSTNCLASGNYVDASSVNQTVVEQWNGTAWSVLTSQNSSATVTNTLSGMGCAGTTTPTCFAAGNVGSNSLVEKWDGASTFSTVTSPNPAASDYLYGVTCSDASTCLAAGSASSATFVVRWEGGSWTTDTVPSPGTSDTLLSVACASSIHCFAAGYFNNGVNAQATLILEMSTTAPTAPTVTSVTPNGGPTSGGQFISVSGTSFMQGSTTVTVGGASATSVTVSSTTLLTAAVPAGTAGTADVVVSTSGVSSATGSADHYTYYTPGAVDAWGSNADGQMGDATTTDRHSPVASCASGQTTNPCSAFISGIVAVAGGQDHTVALKSDGTVWTWGYNTSGQLGDATTTNRSAPVEVCASGQTTNPCSTFLTGIVAVAAGSDHTIALKNDGTVWAWGANANGELGDATTTQRTVPVQVCASGQTANPCSAFLTGVVAIAGGDLDTVALKNDGSVWAWGDNTAGELGDTTTTQRTAPVEVCATGQTTNPCSSFLGGIVAVTAGQDHTVALKSDGSVWDWGTNADGALGDTTLTARYAPVEVCASGQTSNPCSAFLGGITAIAAGTNSTVAVKSDGTLWGWGYNGYGQLGDATTANRSAPVETCASGQTSNPCSAFLSGVTAVGESGTHAFTTGAFTVALKSDGTVWESGSNASGNLGDATTTQRTAPVKTCAIGQASNPCSASLTGVLAVSAGDYHTVALTQGPALAPTVTAVSPTSGSTAGGTSVAITGTNLTAATGVSFGATAATSFTVNSATSITATSPAEAAGTVDITVTTGNGTSATSSADHFTFVTPPTVTLVSPARGPTTGGQFVMIAGTNFTGATAVKFGTTAATAFTVQSATLISATVPAGSAGAVDITVTTAAGTSATGSADQYVYLLPDALGAWGNDDYGELGNATTCSGSPCVGSTTPVQVSSVSGVIAVAGGAYHSLALKSDGTVWSWGNNVDGQLGNGGVSNSSTPVQVSTISGVVAIAAGLDHSVALKSDGTVWDWGFNNQGQLGNGTTTFSSTPVQASGLSNVVAIAAGGYHTLALKSDGTVWAWGNNDYGELGNGTTCSGSPCVGSTTAVQVSGLSGCVAIAAGEYHSLALKSDATVWDWGYGALGQLGNGGTANSSAPVQVSGLTGATAIAGGALHSVALKADGTVWDWGTNNDGQLGNGTLTNSSAPVQAGGVTGTVSIAGGGWHTVALKSDGTTWSWGDGIYGQLGNSGTASSSSAVQVSIISGVTAISAGWYHDVSVAPAGTSSTAVTTSGSRSTYDTTVTFTATVTFSGSLTSGETMTFCDGGTGGAGCTGGTLLGTGSINPASGIATYTTALPGLGVGVHTVLGYYPGDGWHPSSSGTVSQTVNAGTLSVSAPSTLTPSLTPGTSSGALALGGLSFTNTLGDGSGWNVKVAATDLCNGTKIGVPFTNMTITVGSPGSTANSVGTLTAGTSAAFSGTDSPICTTYSTGLTLATGTSANAGTWTQGNNITMTVLGTASTGTYSGTVQYTITG